MIEQKKLARKIKIKDNIAFCMTELNRQKMKKGDFDNFYTEEKIYNLIVKIKDILDCSLLTASNELKNRIKAGVFKA